MFLTKAQWWICPVLTTAHVQDVRYRRETTHIWRKVMENPSLLLLYHLKGLPRKLPLILLWSVGTVPPHFGQKDERSSVSEQAAARCCVLAAMHVNEGKEKGGCCNEIQK